MLSDEKRTGEDLAIQVRAGYKSFGRDSRRVHVMKNFNMSVPRGNIYGLLGKPARLGVAMKQGFGLVNDNHRQTGTW